MNRRKTIIVAGFVAACALLAASIPHALAADVDEKTIRFEAVVQEVTGMCDVIHGQVRARVANLASDNAVLRAENAALKERLKVLGGTPQAQPPQQP